jgi:hypothetical protein
MVTTEQRLRRSPLKRRSISARLQGTTSQKTAIFMHGTAIPGI